MQYQCVNKHPKTGHVRRAAGFTLLELLVVIAIVGIVAAIGFSGFQSWTRFSQVKDASQSLKSAVTYARAEAIKHGGRVKICGSTNSLFCNADFATGWLVYYDANNNNVFNAADEILLVNEQPHANVAITVSDGSGNQVLQLGFNHRGYPDTIFSVAASQGVVSEQFTLQPTGRIETL